MINVILNYLLIGLLGVEGAAIATLVGYMVTVIMVCIITRRMNLMGISKRFLLGSVVTIGYILTCRVFIQYNMLHQVLLSTISIAIYLLIYKYR